MPTRSVSDPWATCCCSATDDTRDGNPPSLPSARALGTDQGAHHHMMLDLDGEELVSAAEVATRLGLKRSRQVLDLRLHRFRFPRPVGRTRRKRVWSWPQVASWAEPEGFGGPGPARPMGGDVSL